MNADRSEVKIPYKEEICFKIYAPHGPQANSAVMSTLTIHCQWEDEMKRERTGHPPYCNNDVTNTSVHIVAPEAS